MFVLRSLCGSDMHVVLDVSEFVDATGPSASPLHTTIVMSTHVSSSLITDVQPWTSAGPFSFIFFARPAIGPL